MAFGARFLAAKQAIVSRLASIEELAGVDVLCSDKTGTLTQNKLTVGESFSLGPRPRRRSCARLRWQAARKTRIR